VPQLFRQRHPQSGFTLAELTIVLVIIAIITVAVMKGTTIIDSSKVSDLIAKSKDLAAAAKTFREQHKYWPGDLPNAGLSIQNLPAACDLPLSTPSIGDGLINSDTEIACAIEQLFQAQLIRAEIITVGALHSIPLDGGTARLVGAGSSNVANFSLGTIVVELQNVRCGLVLSVDSKIDDGNIAFGSTGRAKSSVPSCTVGGANDPVPFYAIAIN